MSVDIKIRVQDRELRRLEPVLKKTGTQVENISKQQDKFTQANTGLTRSLGALRNKLLVYGFATTGVSLLIKKMISAASDLEESTNAVNVVFKEGAETVLKFGKNAATSVGLTQSAFNQLSAVTGALLKDVGLPLSEVAKLTNALTVRAADMASVFNTNVADALSAINQAIRGETEAIRRYAGDITDASLQTFALSQGIDKQVSSMTQQEKKLLRVKLIFSQTEDVQGDFKETQDSLANSARILSSRITDLAADLGNNLVPAAEASLRGLNALIDAIERFRQNRAQAEFFPNLAESEREIRAISQHFKDLNKNGNAFEPLIALQETLLATSGVIVSNFSFTEELNKRLIESAKAYLASLVKTPKTVKQIVAENIKLAEANALQNRFQNEQVEKIKVRIPRDRETVNLAVTRAFAEKRTNEILTTQLKAVKNIAADQGEVAVNAKHAGDAIDDQVNSASQLGDRILSAAFAMRALVDAARGGSLTLSSILGAASFIPGPQQPFLRAGSLISGAFGFQHGGQFTVGGAGGVDSQFVGFKATPGETVTVTTPNQTINSNNRTTTTNAPIFNLSFSGFPADDFQLRKFVNRLSQMVENGEIHITASEIA